MARILIVEDESIVALNMQHTLVRLGYEVVGVAGTSAEAISLAHAHRPDLILMDINLGRGGDGIETAAKLSAEGKMPVIYLTAYSEEATLKRARETKPYGYLLKPFSERELHATLQMAVERCRSDAALAEGEERLRLALDAAQMATWELDIGSGRLQCRGFADCLLGEEIQTFDGSWTALLDHVAPEDREAVCAAHAEAVGHGGMMSVEFRGLRADGTRRWMQVQARTFGQPGAMRRLIGVAQDITARRQAEQRLLETSSLLRTVLDSASEISIIATDPGLTIKVLNTGAERLLGYASTEMVGRAMPALIHDMEEVRARAEKLAADLGHPLETGAALVDPSTLQQAREWTYLRKDGGRVTVSLVVTAMHTDAGELLGYLSVARDATREIQHDELLRKATHAAEQANLAKSQFLANMSHEIRTPMNAVIGLSYLLGRTKLDAEQAAFLAKIKHSSRSLLSVINDVLDLSKIEAGELIVECAAFSPHRLLAELADIMALQAQTKGLDFEIDLAKDLPAALVGDSTRLSQILTNLLSNAIKFTEHGRVSLRARPLAATAEGVTLRFDVQDSGIGIAPEAQARLFAPFAQADASTTRRFGGTGLGLSIVKRLVNLMGGRVSVRSSAGAGSEFTIELNFAVASPNALAILEASPDAARRQALMGVRVLVVDDSDINLEVTKRILELEGAQVELADNGQKAVERLLNEPCVFDVVLMDVQMPVMDGVEATRRIRKLGGRFGSLPILGLTANVMARERERYLEAGMNGCLMKPIEWDLLNAALASCVPAASVLVNIPAINSMSMMVGAEEFQSMLQQAIEAYGGYCGSLSEASTAEEAAAEAHKIKGSAGTLGLCGIAAAAVALEAAADSGEATGELVAALKTAVDDTREVLKAPSYAA